MGTSGKVYVIGAAGHAKVIISCLRELGHVVVGVFDDDANLWGKNLCGIPIFGPVDQIRQVSPLPTVIGIGSNAVRRRLAEKLDLPWLTVVSRHAVVDPSVKLGRGSAVLQGAVVQADAAIGDHVIINTSASVDHDCVVGDYAHIAPGVHLAGTATIGEGALLGVGAMTIPGKKVGAWTTVGAGAVVTVDLPSGVVAFGVPARVIRQRGDAMDNGEDRTEAIIPPNRGRT